jgi:hypothetical protein
MLYVSVPVCLLALLIANVMVRRDKEASWNVLALGLALTCCTCFCSVTGVIFPILFAEGISLCLIFAVWKSAGCKQQSFLAISLFTTALVIVVASLVGIQYVSEDDDLREKFPMQALGERLPLPKASFRTLLPGAAIDHLNSLEANGNWETPFRTSMLRVLHESAFNSFVNSPGFGVTRRIRPSESNLTYDLRDKPAPLQPGKRATSLWYPDDLRPKPPVDEKNLFWMHSLGLEDFVYVNGWGYVQDRLQVAGFQSHRFSQVPRPTVHWSIHALDLVSLLLHDEPVVYISDRLPQMDKVHDVPTRPLDNFETAGLEALRRGEDLFLGEVTDGLRMLGAVRSIKQCLDCHGGERGDLLGAFSYTLRK